MKLSLSEISSRGGFSGPPVKREIGWARDGETVVFDVYVKRMAYQSAVSDVIAIQAGGDIAAHRIATSIVDENGAPVFSVSDITGVLDTGEPVMTENETGEMVERGALDGELAIALLAVIAEVNGLGKHRETPS